MIVAGTVFLYIGVKQFFNKKVNLRIIIPIVSVFFFGLLYFLLVDNDIQIRSVIINASIAILAYMTAYSLFVDKTPSIAASANFNGLIFVLHGALFTYRAIAIFHGTPMGSFLTPTFFNYIPFLDALVVSLLWTFGLIIMLNNRLHVEMSEAQDDLHQLFNLSPDAAIIVRLDDGTIADINNGCTAITGYTREDLLGKSIMDAKIWKNIEDRKNMIRILKEKYYCENFEAQFIRKDGVELTGLLSAKIIHLQGVPHIISIARDISGRKKMERALRESNHELQKVIAEKDKFFSILAHDLRSPFNSFLGFTQVMAEDLLSMTLEEIHKIAVIMQKSATNLYGLLENLLEWSILQRGVIVFIPESIQLRSTVLKSLEPVMDSATKKEIRINFEIEENTMVFADPHMLHAIMRNLVSNAIKYTPRGGLIAISTRNLPGQFLEIIVKDTGIGIGQNILGNIFRLDCNTNRPGTDGEPSTGLGLIICKEFVETHGGKIWVDSEEGTGSTFHFTLKQNNPNE